MSTKACPTCAEQIALTAKKCRFCGEWIDKTASIGPPGSAELAACPQCGLKHAVRVTFTWWGGVLGPKLFTHVKCDSCGTQYNGKTGKSNTVAIGIYTAVALVLALVIGFAAFKAR
ncbi:hypothetical protein HY251_17835 [bacterium]|nr:hypothetical protein [bacterium]